VGIGVLHGAFVQTLLLRSGLDAHAAGASAVVYGLLALCMVWAPRNELSCTAIFLIGFRVLVYHWDLRYTTVALLYVGEQVLWFVLTGSFGVLHVPGLGHLSGALWGTVFGIVLLKMGWVDCEGWDIFTLWANRRKLAKEWKERGHDLDRKKVSIKKSVRKNVVHPETEADAEERASDAVRRVQKLIDKGDVPAALMAYDKAARTLVAWPPQADLLAMIKGLHAQKAEVDSIRLMRDHCRYYPAASTRIRMKLAQVLIRDRQRPAAALRVLGELSAEPLPPDLEKTRQALVRKATEMQEEGVLELEGDD
jgi:hypothetical protein